ncbi:branched-chain amino acid ABC transporter permease [Streptomyces sp. DSM 44917]|uniref:Branched-chain amino acid ABC transporter permease n=1 Tax=Streptomyces boetiae TaxID=3075541 RepID=A0ABU2L7A3_9ACTN|nr:branched-chain amino acid ABC transporter permease [Streptomyces sp. DSM 44917]MDT0307331.1 branched-chain amino acid ABC transporter permease [Streptomyces sp. DSM 44917]
MTTLPTATLAGAPARRPALRNALLTRAAPALAVAVLLLAPLAAGDYRLFQFGRVAAVAVVLVGLHLLTGRAGLISVGHGALMGIGAYLTAILVHHQSWSYLAAVPAAALACAVLGALLGVPALRIRGLYLALVTLSLAIALPPVLKRFKDLTGGPLGITPRPPDLLLGGLTAAQSTYLVAALGLTAVMAGAVALGRSAPGRRFAAVKASDAMAAACGIPVAQTKIVAFAISSFLAGAGGALYLTVVGTVTPDTFTVTLSITLLTGAVVGGLHSGAGAVVGALFFVFVPDVTAGLGGQAPQITYALALLAAVYFLPSGLAGLPGRLLSWWTGRSGRGRRTTAPGPVRPPSPSPHASPTSPAEGPNTEEAS